MELLNCSRPTYYNYKKGKNKALALINKYFSDEELIEYLSSGKVDRLETYEDYAIDPVFAKHTNQVMRTRIKDDKEMTSALEFLHFTLNDKNLTMDISKITPMNAQSSFLESINKSGQGIPSGHTYPRSLLKLKELTDFELYLLVKFSDKFLPKELYYPFYEQEKRMQRERAIDND